MTKLSLPCSHLNRSFWSALISLTLLPCANAAEVKLHGHSFTIPDGFEMALVAGPPLVDRPIVADFDEQGHLYVADSSGSNEKVEKQLAEKPHRIVRLEDTDHDGRFDKSTIFADKMMFPEGTLWFDGSLYVSAPPSIWKLTDRDGDGVAEQREEWFKGKTLTGCANDLHGPYLGYDGWIYWCKGAFAKQTHERTGQPTISDSAAHIFRCRPDGTAFDSVMSGGMDNPVEIAFTPENEAIFTTTFYTNPEGGKRDALVHAIYGGVYPKVNGVLDGLTRTGDLMPALTHLGPAAPSGLTRYDSTGFGKDFEGNLFSTLFNMRKVVRHVLRQQGATFDSTDSDFLVSDNPDFHPTDVLEDADGSLLVVDTGGWYKICCPTSQLAKPEVLGAIYRVRLKGTPRITDPRGLALNWSGLKPRGLTSLLDDARPPVRRRAIAELARFGDEAIPTLNTVMSGTDRPSVQTRRNAVWALTRIDGPEARESVRRALADADPSVRQAAIHSAGIHRDGAAASQLVQILRSGSPHLQRNSATALGRIGDKSAVPVLLSVAGTKHDRTLEHALIYALIEIGDRTGTAAGLPATSSHTRRAALIALDQMRDGALKVVDVSPYLTSTDPVLKETAFWITAHHPEWGSELSSTYRDWLTAKTITKERRELLVRQLGQLASSKAVQDLCTDVLSSPTSGVEARIVVLQGIGNTKLKELPSSWVQELRRALSDPNGEIVRQTLLTVRSTSALKTNATGLIEVLLELAGDAKRSEDLRLDALTALPSGVTNLAPAIFEFLRQTLQSANSPVTRSAAATVLGRIRLSEDQLLSLTDSIKSAGPLELSRLIGAFQNCTNQTVGLRLIAALKESKGVAGLRAESLKPRLAKFPSPVQEAAGELLGILDADFERQKTRLEEVHSALQAGNRDRGRRIFESAQTACVTCHQIGYIGGKVGPDLTRVGAIRTDRDLLESLLFPSASFVRSYEPMIVTTKDGEEFSGVLRQEAADSIVLVTGAGAEQRLATAQLRDMRPGSVSVMPEGLDGQLTKQELGDLIAFLKSLK